MDTLFKALESRGCPVEIQAEYHKVLGVRVEEEPIEFGIEERFKRIDHPDQKNSRLKSWQQRRQYRYIPTGSLFLRINAWDVDGLQKTWSDGKTAMLERYLNDFLIGLTRVAEATKARRLKQEEAARLEREAERRRQEEVKKSKKSW